jgi:hypothetical protein
MIEHPVRHDLNILESAKDLADTLVKLGPRYEGNVPLAAVYLDQQISDGTLKIAVSGRPGQFREMPLAEMAAQLSTPSTMQDLRQKFLEAQLDWTAELRS